MDEPKDTVICALCQQPAYRLEIGPHKYQLWVHRGEALQTCQALRLDYNYLLPLFRRMQKLKQKFGIRFDVNGNVKPHGAE